MKYMFSLDARMGCQEGKKLFQLLLPKEGHVVQSGDFRCS